MPLGAAPMPWPSIVHNHGVHRDTPTLAGGEDALPTSEAVEGKVEPVSVLVAADTQTDAANPSVESDRIDPWKVIPTFDVESDDSAALAETPGWRPRTPR